MRKLVRKGWFNFLAAGIALASVVINIAGGHPTWLTGLNACLSLINFAIAWNFRQKYKRGYWS